MLKHIHLPLLLTALLATAPLAHGQGLKIQRVSQSLETVETIPGQALYVNSSPDTTVESPDGTEAAPFPTLKAGLDAALNLLQEGEEVRLLIAPGIYRESLKISETDAARALAPFTIKAEVPGSVIIDGSVEWVDNWSVHETTGDYMHPFPEDWQESPRMEGIPQLVTSNVLVFLNEGRQIPVFSRAELIAGSYTVSEGTLYIRPKKGQFIRNNQTALIPRLGDPTRATLLSVTGMTSLRIEGLKFRYAAGAPGENAAAISFKDCDNIEIIDCQLEYNNFTGARFENCTDLHLLRFKSMLNGYRGLEINGGKNVILQGLEVSQNGWRIHHADFPVDFLPEQAAIVLTDIEGLSINDLITNENHTHAVYIDKAWSKWDIYRVFAARNKGNGFYINLAHDLTIRAAQIAYNFGAGIDMLGQVTLHGCTFYANGDPAKFKATLGQIIIPSAYDHYTLKKNVVISAFEEAPLIRIKPGGGVFPELDAAYNIYFHYDSEHPFNVMGYGVSMSVWREVFGTDTRSAETDPLLAKPEEYDFSALPDGPAFLAESLPEVPLQMTVEEARKKYLPDLLTE